MTEAPPAIGTDRMTRWILLGCVAVLVFHLVVAVQVGFLSDDFAYLQTVRGLQTAGQTAQFIAKPLGTSFEWRPATGVTWILESAIFGNASWAYHAVRIILLAGSAWFLFLLGRKLMGEQAGALTALLFLIMPFHAESIYWLAAITDLLALLGALAAIYFGLQYLSDGRLRNLFWSCFMLLVGITGKEIAVVTPALLAVVDLVLHGWKFHQPRRRWMLYASLVAITLFLLAGRTLIIGSLTGVTGTRSPFGAIFTLAPYKALVSRMILLFNVKALHDLSARAASLWVNWRKIGAAAVVIGLYFVALPRFRDRRFIGTMLVGLAFLIGFSVPQAYVLPAISLQTLQHSRFLFAPSAGLALMLGTALAVANNDRELWRRWLKSWLLLSFLIVFGLGTVVNAQPWLQAANRRDQVLNDLSVHFSNVIQTTSPTVLYPEKIPKEINGAFIFRERLSFSEAVWRRFNNPNLTVVLPPKRGETAQPCEPSVNTVVVCLRWNGSRFEETASWPVVREPMS